MIRRMHEGTDSLEERMAVTTEGEAKISNEESTSAMQVPEVVGETVEVDADASLTAMNTDKNTKSTSTSSSEDIDEETLEEEEKIGKDGN